MKCEQTGVSPLSISQITDLGNVFKSSNNPNEQQHDALEALINQITNPNLTPYINSDITRMWALSQLLQAFLLYPEEVVTTLEQSAFLRDQYPTLFSRNTKGDPSPWVQVTNIAVCYECYELCKKINPQKQKNLQERLLKIIKFYAGQIRLGESKPLSSPPITPSLIASIIATKILRIILDQLPLSAFSLNDQETQILEEECHSLIKSYPITWAQENAITAMSCSLLLFKTLSLDKYLANYL